MHLHTLMAHIIPTQHKGVSHMEEKWVMAYIVGVYWWLLNVWQYVIYHNNLQQFHVTFFLSLGFLDPQPEMMIFVQVIY